MKIINHNYIFNKKDCIAYIIFFTFATMKKSQNKRNYSSNKNRNTMSFLRMLKRFYSIKGNFSFDIFQYFKADNEKLQIIYANIRV